MNRFITRIDPITGVDSKVGDSGLEPGGILENPTFRPALAFDNMDTLYFVNGSIGTPDYSVYTFDTETGAATDTGVDFPGRAHHGTFHPESNEYYGVLEEMVGEDIRRSVGVFDIETGNLQREFTPMGSDSVFNLAFVELAEAEPDLQIGPEGDQVIVGWEDSGDWMLEESSDLTSWTLSSQGVLAEGRRELRFTQSTERGFFRLVR